MPDKTRLAMIGCGRWANRVHFPSLASFDDVEIAGICDLDATRLAATGDRYGVAARFADFRAMLDAVRPDAVYVIMPETGRFEIVREVLRRGHPVFIEKPPSRTTGEIRELAALAEAKGLITMVGTNRRFIPVLVEARRRMLERGAPQLVVATYYKNEMPETVVERRAWDVLVSDGIHAVDTMRWLAGASPCACRPSVGARHAVPAVCGDPVRVQAVGRGTACRARCVEEPVRVQAVAQRLNAVCDVVFQALVEFDNGCIGVLLLSWAAGSRYHAFEIHAGGATAYVLPDEGARIVADGRTEPIWSMSSSARMSGDGPALLGYGFLQENRHFLDSLRSRTPTLSPFSDAVKSMELIDMIKSACAAR